MQCHIDMRSNSRDNTVYCIFVFLIVSILPEGAKFIPRQRMEWIAMSICIHPNIMQSFECIIPTAIYPDAPTKLE